MFSIDRISHVFSDVAGEIYSGNFRLDRMEKTIIEIISNKFSSVVGIMVIGSALTCEFKPFSDIDVIVLTLEGPNLQKICFYENGYLFDVFALNSRHCDKFIAECLEQGIKFPIFPAIEGNIIFECDGVMKSFQEKCVEAFRIGPKKKDKKTVDGVRLFITNQLSDIARSSNMHEMIVPVMALYNALITVQSISSDGWTTGPKHFRKIMAGSDPAFLLELTNAYKDFYVNEDPASLCEFALNLLNKISGPLWAGFSFSS